ncbi:MAG: branched-chain amino acid ABC transporter permease [Rhizobiales bacterium]|nr:branched-chain amino acid ABC transporter permease [Hyphomicrobiales bacterium]
MSGYWLQQTVNGLVLASLYVTLATAYALLQGITNRIILSFGDFATFGALTAVYVAIWALLDGAAGFAVMGLALIAALAASAGLGRLSHSLVFAPLIRSPNQAVMITSIGLSIVLQETMRLQTGARDQWLPPLIDDAMVLRQGAYPVLVGYARLGAVAVSATTVLGLVAVMRYSAAGRLWRATAQNARLAQLSGVDTAAVFRWSFIAASMLAAVSGWLIAVTYGGVSFAMGLVLGFKAMFAAIIGGFGTIGGAIAGGIFLAFVETAWSAALPLAYRDVAVFAIIIAILVLKPEGLLGVSQRRDSED